MLFQGRHGRHHAGARQNTELAQGNRTIIIGNRTTISLN